VTVAKRDPSPITPAAMRERLKAENIDDLLTKLNSIKAQKAELELLEKEMVSILKEKLKEQQQQIQRLGIRVEERDANMPRNATGGPPPVIIR
jgi:hypothetical protein